VAALPDTGWSNTLTISSGVIATKHVLLRAVMLLASWAVGLLVAAWTVPGVSLSVAGFLVAVGIFATTQAILSLSILKLPHAYASMLLGGTGLVLTIVSLALASLVTHGLAIDGVASWIAATTVVWLVTTVGAITLPELLARDGTPARSLEIHYSTRRRRGRDGRHA